MSIVILLAILAAAPNDALQSRALPLTEEQVQSLDPVGSCEGNGRSINMRRVMFLENLSVDIDGPNGELRVSVNRTDLVVEEIGSVSQRRRFINDIADLIDTTGEIDIQLKLAYFDGRLVLYWKETFQNRHYRQGLFNILGTNVSPLCSGLGGSHVVR
jgi:hypothetical protein